MTLLLTLLLTTVRGQVTMGFLSEQLVQQNSWQGDGEWGNVGLDLLPVIVLIHS